MARNSNNLEGGSLFSGQYSKMERSSSFREGLESRAAGTPRSTQHASDIPPLTQYLNLELPTREQQQKSRSAELRRMLGTGLDDHGFGSAQSKAVPTINPEEMKRFKASLSESASKAGESAKFFQDQVAKVEKYKNMVAKKRQRSSDMSGEKTGGSNFPKSGGSHSGSPVNQVLPVEHMGQRQEDRPKNLIPNKRARSSLGESRSEGRALGSMRQAPPNSEKDKSTFEKDKSSTGRVAGNGGPTTSEEKPRALTPGGDGWEKKLKRKRSVGSMVNRANDGANADSKQSASPRPNISNPESRRSNDNGLGFRSGLPSGTIGVNKTDLSSQQSSGNGTRNSVKVDNDNNPTERREQRSSALEKDRSISKGNKLVPRDESQGSSLNPMAKTKASRAQRSSSFVVMNSSPTFPRFPGSSSDGWDSPGTANKVQNSTPPGQSASNAPATSNRKRPLPSGPPSPSPPTQWVGARPQKIQRTRRANVVSPVSNFDEIQAPNDGSAESPSASIQNNAGSSTVMQHKSKGDVVSSPLAGLSESEESKGKGVENGEMAENKASISTNKKANRVLLKEELGDGVRRQGRSGRGSGPGHGRSLPPLPKEKVDGNESTTKPPKSGRPVSDKNDSRIGRPPLKKVDRKSQGRPGQNSHVAPSEMIGGMDDDKEELLSVINAARTACYDACTGPFWKKMEPVFTSASNDLSFLKNQIAFAEALDRSASDVIADKYNNEEKDPGQLSPSSHKGTVDPTLIGFTGRAKTDDWLVQAVPLSQMLLSAFISIDGSEPLLDSNDYTPNGDSDHYPYEKVDKGQCNGFLDGTLLTSHSHNGPYSQSISQNHEMVLNSAGPIYECQYEDMSLDNRILLELHSIGIYPDSGPELDEGEGAIDMSASELQKELTQKVMERKSIMQTLVNVFPDTKRIDERHLEHLAMDKLVERACKKLSGGRGGSSHKGGANKLSKQLAQAFGKRTLDRCRRFEGSGQSCFSSDPSLRDILFAPLQCPDSKQPDGVNERRKLDRGPSDALEQSQVKTDQISSRGKKREVLLEEVSRGTTSVFGPRWKKSDQTKDGSGKNSSPNTNAKGSRGERKNKTKPKQKMGHLSSSNSDVDKVITAEVGHLDVVSGSSNKPGQHKTQLPGPANDMNDSLFAGLPIPFDDLDSVTGDANDLGSWLNVDDESLQDTDLVGLEIPMDDLADLTFT